MPAKTPKLDHIRYVRTKGKVYAYFDTGKRKPNGRPVYIAMPPVGSFGFFDTYASMKGSRTKTLAPTYTVADLARDYEGSGNYRDLAPRSQIVYSSVLRRVVEFLGKAPVESLTPEIVQAVLDNDIKGAASHNMFVGMVGTIYSWARSPRGGSRTTLKPTEGIGKRKTGEHQPWPTEIVEAGVNAKDDDIRLMVRLLYFTGQRIGDVLKMRWSDVRNGILEVTQQKTGKTVFIPLLAELREELDRTKKRGLTIVANLRGQKRSVDVVRVELQAFTEKLGVKTVPHGLRKNAVNALLEAGCTVAETSSITGQTYQIVEHYAKQINQRGMAEAAILKLENKRGSRKTDRKQA